MGRNQGPLVCTCFAVGLTAIRTAIAGGAITTALIGKALRAGTHCSACLPELRRILAEDLAARSGGEIGHDGVEDGKARRGDGEA